MEPTPRFPRGQYSEHLASVPLFFQMAVLVITSLGK